MPKRTNTFQQVVAILHQHLAGGAEVEESAMLVDRVTGDEKEVDVVIRSTVAGQEMVLGVEATKQKASRPWVEFMIEKHRNLATNRLVLVAERGASRPAYRYAASAGAVLFVPEHLTGGDPVYKVVNRLERVWPRGVALTPKHTWITVRRDGAVKRIAGDAPPDLEVFLTDGRSAGTPFQVFEAAFDVDFPRMAEMIRLTDITDDRDEYFHGGLVEPDSRWTHPRESERLPLCLKWAETGELHPIARMEFSGRAVVEVGEVRLSHWRFQDTAVAYGEGRVGGRDALLVVTENDGGDSAITMTLGAAQHPPDATDADTVDSDRYAAPATDPATSP